jgi:hypothetical protein
VFTAPKHTEDKAAVEKPPPFLLAIALKGNAMPANDPELYGSTTKQLLVGFDIQMLKEMHARQEKEDAEKAAEDPKVNKSPAATDNAPDKDAGEETGGEEPEDNPSEDAVNEDSEDSEDSDTSEPDEPADEYTDTKTDTAPAKPKAMFDEKTGKSEAPHSMDNIWDDVDGGDNG